MTNGKVKTENGKLIAHPLAAHLYRPLRPSGTSPNLGEESGGGLTFWFQVSWGWEPGFKFYVSRFKCVHPLCLPKIGVTSPQGGGGMPNGKRKCENGKLIAEARKLGHGMPCPKHPRCHLLHWRTRHAVSLQAIICTLYSVICTLSSVYFFSSGYWMRVW